jgi:hypothetical protein
MSSKPIAAIGHVSHFREDRRRHPIRIRRLRKILRQDGSK